MPPRKKSVLGKKKAPVKKFSFQLSLSAIAGITVVIFCLFLWMFLIGIWAGQTIIFPPVSRNTPFVVDSEEKESVLADTRPVEILLRPRERKKRIAPLTEEHSSPAGDP